MKGEIVLEVYFYRKDKRRADLDNFLKAFVEACLPFFDDSQIVEIVARKYSGDCLAMEAVSFRQVAEAVERVLSDA
jgi:Holliday junction resolvase RusA-like endonuclease